MIGPYPWKRGGFDRIQNEGAATLGIPRFRYRSSEIDLEKVELPQRKFLTASDVIASGFEDFKDHLAKKLTVLAHQRDRAPGAPGDQDIPPSVVVAIRSSKPDRLWDRVFQWIYEQEGIHPYQLRPGETIDSRSRAEPCHGYLIACDKAALVDGPMSPRTDMKQIRQIQLREKNATRWPPVALVYWPPPEVNWAKLQRITAQKIYRVVSKEPDKLSDFFAEVRKVAQ